MKSILSSVPLQVHHTFISSNDQKDNKTTIKAGNYEIFTAAGFNVYTIVTVESEIRFFRKNCFTKYDCKSSRGEVKWKSEIVNYMKV